MLDDSIGQQGVKENQYALPPTFRAPVMLGIKVRRGRKDCVERIWERCIEI